MTLPAVRLPAALHLFVALTLVGAAFAQAQTATLVVNVTSVAGTGGVTGYADGTATTARFFNPSGIVVDRSGNVYVADSSSNTLRKISPAGLVTTFAGQAVDPDTGIANNGGTANGTGPAAEFSFGKQLGNTVGATTLAIDGNDTIFVADTLNGTVRRISSGAVVTTLNLRDSTGASVQFIAPDGMAIDPGSNLYVTDSGTNTIRRITPDGIVSIYAGRRSIAGNADGAAATATFNNPRGITVDSAGNVFVTDTNNNTIRKISTAGVVSTLAGSPGTPTRKSAGFSDGFGVNARFNAPVGLAIDAAGTLWVADTGNNSIRRITSTGVVTTVAGSSGTEGDSNGTGNAARLRQPHGITAARDGTIYLSDTKNHVIRKLSSTPSPGSISISRQPELQIVNVGQVATFAVTATASAPFSYQWYRNSSPIAGATGAAYSLTSPTLSDDRTYYNVVLSLGTLTLCSSTAQLQAVPAALPIPAVIIITQPADTTVEVGSGTVLAVEATGRNRVSYQWRRDLQPIAGATNAELVISAAQATDAGSYNVVVSSGADSVISNPSELTVVPKVVLPVSITAHPTSQSVTTGQAGSFSVAAAGTPEIKFQWEKNGVAIPGASFATYTILVTQASDAGTYRVTVSNAVNSVVSASASLSLTAAGVAPAITSHPEALAVKTGDPAAFAVTAIGTPAVSYQWQRDGQNLPGATSASYTIASAQLGDAATYRVVVSNSLGSAVSNSASLIVSAAASEASRLINLSILARVDAGETMTLGTVLGGTGTSGDKALVARAAGPSLIPLGVTGVLPDPAITLTRTSTSPAVAVAGNNDWAGSSSLAGAFAQVGAFPYASSASKDAGLFQPNLPTGNYTLQVTDPSGGSGLVIAELYDATPAATFTAFSPRLINVSVLKNVPAGDTLTAGFVIGGTSQAKLKVLIRAAGPSLGLPPFNIPGVMADPKLELYDNSTGTRINENNDWGGATELTQAFDSVGAFQFASGATKDSALLVSLAPGQYSVRVDGNNGSGIAIVEVYEVR